MTVKHQTIVLGLTWDDKRLADPIRWDWSVVTGTETKILSSSPIGDGVHPDAEFSHVSPPRTSDYIVADETLCVDNRRVNLSIDVRLPQSQVSALIDALLSPESHDVRSVVIQPEGNADKPDADESDELDESDEPEEDEVPVPAFRCYNPRCRVSTWQSGGPYCPGCRRPGRALED